MKIGLKKKGSHEKAHRIRAGLSNILIDYVLVSAVQLTKLANIDYSILRASNVLGAR